MSTSRSMLKLKNINNCFKIKISYYLLNSYFQIEFCNNNIENCQKWKILSICSRLSLLEIGTLAKHRFHILTKMGRSQLNLLWRFTLISVIILKKLMELMSNYSFGTKQKKTNIGVQIIIFSLKFYYNNVNFVLIYNISLQIKLFNI